MSQITPDNIKNYAANALRALAMDAVQKANSGHPGQPMGMADVAQVVWNEFMTHNPANPNWLNRDRFVLSGGHGSMLLYGLLHLSGYDLPMEELKNFRQMDSKTPGHPEYGHTKGVEITTGPLGFGLSAAVGMALAERMLAARFNKPGHDLVDHYTFVMCGDGDMQEGVVHEAATLAGHLALDRLIVMFDDNGITIDGSTELSTSEDVLTRFQGYGWQILEVDGHNMGQIEEAIKKGKAETARPTLIACKTVIGFGAPNKGGTHDVHGSPLGDAEVAATRENLGWSWPPFEVPKEVVDYWRKAKERGAKAEENWNAKLKAYKAAFPAEGADLERIIAGKPQTAWEADLARLKETWLSEKPNLATRASSGKTLEAIAEKLTDMIGGSADLTPSNNTRVGIYRDIQRRQFDGRYIRYGIREHGMGAIMNGLAIHSGFIPYGGTFLVFSDHMRPTLRLSALMGVRVIYVFTHDSIGVGEDGPTHQPVEHYAALRAIPNLNVFRPGDAVETAEAWEAALKRADGPSTLLLTRQNLPALDRDGAEGTVADGGYILADAPKGTTLKAIVLATGSETQLAMAAREKLAAEGIGVRVVSMPCFELFEAKPDKYKNEVLPGNVTARVSVESGIQQGWERYTGLTGRHVGMKSFGASAPAGQLFKHFGITTEAVVEAVKAQL